MTADGVESAPETLTFQTAALPTPSRPVSLEQVDTDTAAPLLSGVADVAGASDGQELTDNYFLSDAAGNAVGSVPFASEAVLGGTRSSLRVPAGTLTTGTRYEWHMTACANENCSPPSDIMSFTAGDAVSDTADIPSPVDVTISSGSISAYSAPISETACGGPCTPTTGQRLLIGGDGTNIERAYLGVDVSAIPSNARIQSAILNLGGKAQQGSGVAQVLGYADWIAASPSTDGAALAAGVGDAPSAYMDSTSSSLDITSLMQGWANGDLPVPSMALVASPESPSDGISFSSPTGTDPPSISVTYFPNTPPSQPTAVTAIDGDSGAFLHWSPPTAQGDGSSDDLTYDIQVSDPSGAVVFAENGIASDDVAITNLTNGIDYAYTLTAENAENTGGSVTGSLQPALIVGADNYIGAVEEYNSAVAALGLPGTSPDNILAGDTHGDMFKTRLLADAGEALMERQFDGLVDAGGLAADDATTSAALVVPSTLGAGYDVYASRTENVTADGDVTPDSTTSDFVYHFDSGQNLVGIYAPDATTSSGATGLVGGAQVSTASTTAPLPFAASAETSAPADVALGAGTDTQVSPDDTIPPSGPSFPAVDQTAMASWAQHHLPGNHPECGDENCTCFASKALHNRHGGGLPYAFAPPYGNPANPSYPVEDPHYWFKRPRDFTTVRSFSYTFSEYFKDYLTYNPGHWVKHPLNVRVGDIVFFKYYSATTGTDAMNHTAIVSDTEFGSLQPYESAYDAIYLVQSGDDYRHRQLNIGLAHMRALFGSVRPFIWHIDS